MTNKLQIDRLRQNYKVDIKGQITEVETHRPVEYKGVENDHRIWCAEQNFTLKADQKRIRKKQRLTDLEREILQLNAFSQPDEHVDKWYRDACHEAFAAVRILGISHDPSQLHESSKFLSALMGMGRTTELDVAVFRHMIWQVKRKLQGASTKYEMFFNLVGPQGVGKTYAMRKLFSVLGDCYGEVPLHTILDDRSSFMLKFTYVNMCEELQGADRADLERLKGVITARDISYRVLGTHKIGIVRQNATFFGTSNKSVYDSFRDTTGMRRFYEVTVADQVDPEALAAVNIQAVWDGIDATISEPHYLEPYRQALEERQAAERYLSNFQEWAQDVNIKPGPMYMAGQTLYDHYKAHCTNTMTRPLVRQSFYRELKSAGFQRTSYQNATIFLVDEMTAATQAFKHGVRKFDQLGDA